jgi:hypothetical protein
MTSQSSHNSSRGAALPALARFPGLPAIVVGGQSPITQTIALFAYPNGNLRFGNMGTTTGLFSMGSGDPMGFQNFLVLEAPNLLNNPNLLTVEVQQLNYAIPDPNEVIAEYVGTPGAPFVTPEPASAVLAAVGGFALLVLRCRRALQSRK